MKKLIRTLRADEIECRVQQVNEKGCVLLIYKDARVDMRILDETFGVDGWQRTHEVINGNLFCNIEIWSDDKKCWIKKQDVGTESNTEKEKGEASDSFKRAGFNVGIGRELYSSPFIWIKLDPSEIEKNAQGKPQLSRSVKFGVTSIKYDENKDITELIISDNKGNIRFTYGSTKTAPKTATKAPEQTQVIDERKAVCNILANNAEALSYYKKKHLFTTIDELTDGQIKEIYQHLKKYNKI
jgi:hypothetical protein